MRTSSYKTLLIIRAKSGDWRVLYEYDMARLVSLKVLFTSRESRQLNLN